MKSTLRWVWTAYHLLHPTVRLFTDTRPSLDEACRTAFGTETGLSLHRRDVSDYTAIVKDLCTKKVFGYSFFSRIATGLIVRWNCQEWFSKKAQGI